MRPLHQILTKLQDAVSRRTEEPELGTMNEGELRTLIYQIVETYERKLAIPDPHQLFEKMVDSAVDTFGRFKEAKTEASRLRAQLLARMLVLVGHSMPALGGPVRAQIVRAGGSQTFVNHAYLRGIELAQNRKLHSVDGVRTIVGRSWWVVSLAGEHTQPDARWAVIDHRGSLDGDGCGQEDLTIDIVETLALAEQISDRIAADMLMKFSDQLRDVSDGQLPRLTDQEQHSILKLQAALQALELDHA